MTTDPNYAPISYTAGTLTINPAALSVTANDASMTYGGTYPTLDATFGGLVNGDTQASENALTVCAGTSVPANSPAGTYAINCVTTSTRTTRRSATPRAR